MFCCSATSPTSGHGHMRFYLYIYSYFPCRVFEKAGVFAFKRSADKFLLVFLRDLMDR